MTTIEVNNVKAIQQLRFDVPVDGGLVLLKGTHGTGKSTAIDAIQTALRQDGRLELADGAERGSVQVGGAKVTVTRGRTQHGGELLVESIEGKFSLKDLIDPGLKDQERADAKRIQTMLALANVKADAALFAELTPLVDVSTIKADDLVTLAAKAKSALELDARDAEAAAANALDKAKRESPPPDAVLEGARPPSEVAVALEAAIKHEASLQARYDAATAAHAKHQAARAELAGVDLEALESAAAVASGKQTAALEHAKELTLAANDLRERLKVAESKLATATTEAANAVREAKAAALALTNAKSLDKRLAEALPDLPDGHLLAEAARDVIAARTLSDQNAVILGHVAQAAKAAEHFATHDRFSARAKRLRDAAARIDGILSEAIAGLGSPLRVRSGRLVLDTHRGVELFGDLSHGERTLAAINIGLGMVQSGGILPIDQESYGGLNDDDEAELAVKAKARNVLVLAAVVTTDDELSVEVV